MALLDHFGLEARTIRVGCPEQNGDIEASNGGLKRALNQHLLLRGSREFASLEAYEQFIETVPAIPRDEKKMDDVDTDAEDHIADESRYRCMTPRYVSIFSQV